MAAEVGMEAEGGEAGGAATKLGDALAQRSPLVARYLKTTIDELLAEDGEGGKGGHSAPDISLPDGVSLEDYATLAVRADDTYPSLGKTRRIRYPLYVLYNLTRGL